MGSGKSRGKADKGGAAASGFCPPYPRGFSEPKPVASFKKKKKEKKHLRKVTDNYHTHTRTHTPNRSPISPPPPPNTIVSCFHFFFKKFLPATSPSGSQRYDCWWVVTGTRRAETHLWPEGGGSASPFYIFHPHTHQPPSFWLPVGEGGKNRWSQRLSNQHFRPSHLACPCPSPTERIVSPWARNQCTLQGTGLRHAGEEQGGQTDRKRTWQGPQGR